MSAIGDQLSRIERQQERALLILEGDERAGIEGVVPCMQRLDGDICQLNEWRKTEIMRKEIRKENVRTFIKVFVWAGGVLTFVFGAFEFLEHVLTIAK